MNLQALSHDMLVWSHDVWT